MQNAKQCNWVFTLIDGFFATSKNGKQQTNYFFFSFWKPFTSLVENINSALMYKNRSRDAQGVSEDEEKKNKTTTTKKKKKKKKKKE